ncbi:MAG: methylmalonyl-CoA mutase [Planctomycetes bacterium]|nr:methylmalonyl-CoA mutase [Planctomycetota bacterium]
MTDPRPASDDPRYRAEAGKHGLRRPDFRTISGIPLEPWYGDAGPGGKNGLPGQSPFARGLRATGYRGRLWTMRQYAGFTSAEETNARFRYLLSLGQTGLSCAFDLPTQIGYDSDHEMSAGEVGKVGVPINSLRDMETLLDGIPLGEVTLSMTINATAAVLLAMVVATARKRGVPLPSVGGTTQNDVLKEFAARNTHRFPEGPSLRLVTDVIEWSSANLPQWNPISISGYHMREAGCTAVQEIAFTLSNGLEYGRQAIERGLAPDTFLPRFSFFFASQMDLFEEVAKFRAARRLWARLARERLGAKKDASAMLRFHTQTAGVALTSQQPDNNAIRVAIQALAAVLGGTQSLHTNSRDEALALPSEDSVRLALRTQQILAEETGAASVVDPLGGCPFIEELTDRLEADAVALMAKVDALGGAASAIRKGFMQREIQAAAYDEQRRIDSGDKVVVGVNRYVEKNEPPPRLFKVDESRTALIAGQVQAMRRTRDAAAVTASLDALARSADPAAPRENLFPVILQAVEAYATVGEICATLERVWGPWVPTEE